MAMFPKSVMILVVDDSATIRATIRNELAQMGYLNVREAMDGVDAIEKLTTAEQKIPFALVISDWNMPNMTGVELLEKVRENFSLAKLPFILLTSENEVNQVATAISLNVSGYIIKPLGKGILKQKLEAVWKKHNPTAG